VEGGGVGRGGGDRVEGGVEDALAGGVLGLVDDGDEGGEGGGVKAGAAADGEVAGGGVAQAAVAAGLLAALPEGLVAGAEGEGRVEGRGRHGDVRHHALAGAGDSYAANGSGLPGGLGGIDADAPSTCRSRTALTDGVGGSAGICRNYYVVVPDHLGDVGFRRADDVGGGLGVEVGVVTNANVGRGKLGAAYAGDVLTAGGKVDGELLILGRGFVLPVAVGGTAIAGGGDDGLALGGCLFEGRVEFGVAGLAEVGFAVSVAGADDGRDLLIDGVLDGVEGAEVVVVAGVDEVDLRALGDGAGVLEIEVGLGFIAVGVDLGGTGVGNEDDDGRLAGNVHRRLEVGDVGEIDGGLTDDGDGLVGAGVARVVGRGDVVDGGEVAGGEVVAAGLAGGKARLRGLGGAKDVREEVKVRQVADGEDAGGERRGEGEVGGGGKVLLGGLEGGSSNEIVVQGGAEGRGDLGGGSGEQDAVVAARNGVDGEALLLEPGFSRRDVGVGDAELRGVLVGRDPLVVEGGGGVLLGGDESVEGCLLGGAAAEEQRDAVELEGAGDGAEIVDSGGAGWTRAGEGGAAGGVDR